MNHDTDKAKGAQVSPADMMLWASIDCLVHAGPPARDKRLGFHGGV